MTALLLARLKAAGAPCSEPRTRAAALSYERSRSPEGGTRLRHPTLGIDFAEPPPAVHFAPPPLFSMRWWRGEGIPTRLSILAYKYWLSR